MHSIRMVNAGLHVVISSHSDTMASRLNNLFMLTQLIRKKADYNMLKELDLLDADLLRPDVKADVYEFRNEKQEITIVEKLEFISNPLMGYDFQLFGKNLDKLYAEADKISRWLMEIKARKLKVSEIPGKTALYEGRHSCDIVAEERQTDGSLD